MTKEPGPWYLLTRLREARQCSECDKWIDRFHANQFKRIYVNERGKYLCAECAHLMEGAKA